MLDQLGVKFSLIPTTHFMATIEGSTNDAYASEYCRYASASDETQFSGLVPSLGKWFHNFTHAWSNPASPSDGQFGSGTHRNRISHVEYCPGNTGQADMWDLSLVTQKMGETVRQFWSHFLSKKNKIPDCSDMEAAVAFQLNIREEWLIADLGCQRPRTFAALSDLMKNYCAMEDAWLAK